MKFLMFADLHYFPGVFMGGTWENLKEIQNRALAEGCEFIIHAGDFCHGPSKVEDYVKAYNDFVLPSYHCLGNHDTDHTPYEDTLKYYNMPNGYYFFDHGGYRFIVCDPNYIYADGEYVSFSKANYRKYGQSKDYMPPQELAWLEETIASSPYSCVLISHQSFEREADGVKNYQQVREIINKANEKRPNHVLMCINGHYHRDNIRILDNVCYLDMNAVRYDWVDIEHNLYPQELCEKYAKIKNTVVYNDPLYAIVTLEGNTITIEGAKSSMFMGVNREMTENSIYDKMGRPVVPEIKSAKITLG